MSFFNEQNIHNICQSFIMSDTNTENPKQKYICKVCSYIYDPEAGDPDNGVAPNTPFAEIPEEWTCPLCGVSKEDFEAVEE